jgi:uncharacterized protein YlxW (UPF0749 family)
MDDELLERLQRLQASSNELTETVKQLVEAVTEVELSGKKRSDILEDQADALENSGE